MSEPKRISDANIIILDSLTGHEYHVPVDSITNVRDLTTHKQVTKRCFPLFWKKKVVDEVHPLCRVEVTDRTGACGVHVPHSAHDVFLCMKRNGASEKQLERCGYEGAKDWHVPEKKETPPPPPQPAPVPVPEPKPVPSMAMPPAPVFIVKTKKRRGRLPLPEPVLESRVYTMATKEKDGTYRLKRTYKAAKTITYMNYKHKEELDFCDVMLILGFIQFKSKFVSRELDPLFVARASVRFRKMMKTAQLDIGRRRKFLKVEVVSFARALTRMGWMSAGDSIEGRNITEGAKSASVQHPEPVTAPEPTPMAEPASVPEPAPEPEHTPEPIPEPPTTFSPLEDCERAMASLNDRYQLMLQAQQAQRRTQFTERMYPTHDFLKVEVQLINAVREAMGKPTVSFPSGKGTWRECWHIVREYGAMLDADYPHLFAAHGRVIEKFGGGRKK